jgi:class 3 adenylate cyclase
MTTIPMTTTEESESFYDDSSLIDADIDIDMDDDGDNMSYSTEGSGLDNSDQGDSNTKRRSIARKETKQVKYSKLIFIAILTLLAIFLSVFLYLTLSDTEEDTFVSVYEDRANMIMNAFEFNFERRIGAIDSLGIQITSFARETNSRWPFVTIPDFDVRAASAQKLSGSLGLMLSPLVTAATRDRWEKYSTQNLDWIAETFYREMSDLTAESQGATLEELSANVSSLLWKWESNGWIYESGSDEGPFFPVWQNSPMLPSTINFQLASHDAFRESLQECVNSEKVVLGKFTDATDPNDAENQVQGVLATILKNSLSETNFTYRGGPFSVLNYPVFDGFGTDRNLVATMLSMVFWPVFFADILPVGENGYICVLANECGQNHTFQLNGPDVVYLGEGDRHDSSYDHLERSYRFDALEEKSISEAGVDLNLDYCPLSMHVYASQEIEDEHVTKWPLYFTLCAAGVFLITAGFFMVYDRIVERRQRVLMKSAIESREMVSSLFPPVVHNRLFSKTGSKNKKNADANGLPIEASGSANPNAGDGGVTSKQNLKNYLEGGGSAVANGNGLAKPIADLFPRTTVMFADIAGFTAWSSQREPEQVFTLLQTLYHEFDVIAKKRVVFKVETVGDCYVAVTGLPDPQEDHAVRMVKFARDCMNKMNEMTKILERTLGPDTRDLFMRMGLHSGPVTAGVLRGERSRFQLFGDTVNTASRMESTGLATQIQISQSTADLVKAGGKEYWIRAREEMVEAKGKGRVQTYWVIPQASSATPVFSKLGMLPAHSMAPLSANAPHLFHLEGENTADGSLMWGDAKKLAHSQLVPKTEDPKSERLIDWQVELLVRMLQQVVEFRAKMQKISGVRGSSEESKVEPITTESSVVEEVTESIMLPQIDPKTLSKARAQPVSVELSSVALEQLRDYVSNVSSLYRNNPFHNFEHANHVTQSVNKLLKRVQEQDHVLDNADLHHYTHGVTSDPLTQFAVVFSALIHDVDHEGVSNAQLIKEKPHIGVFYNNQSVAEQVSREA